MFYAIRRQNECFVSLVVIVQLVALVKQNLRLSKKIPILQLIAAFVLIYWLLGCWEIVCFGIFSELTPFGGFTFDISIGNQLTSI
jgi:hypothetical protein